MKHIMRILSIFLFAILISNNMVFGAFASEIEKAATSDSTQSKSIISEQPILRDGSGNQYGYAA